MSVAGVSQLLSSLFTSGGGPGASTSQSGSGSVFAATLAEIGQDIAVGIPEVSAGKAELPTPAATMPAATDAPSSAELPDDASVASSVPQILDRSIAMQIDQMPSTSAATPTSVQAQDKIPTSFALDDASAAGPAPMPSPAKRASSGKVDAGKVPISPTDDSDEPLPKDDKPEERDRRSSVAETASGQILPIAAMPAAATPATDATVRPEPKAAASAPAPRDDSPAPVRQDRSGDPAQSVPAPDAGAAEPIAPALAALVDIAAATQKSDQPSPREVDTTDVSPSTTPGPIAPQMIRQAPAATATIMTARAAATPAAPASEQKTDRHTDKDARGSGEGGADPTDSTAAPNTSPTAAAPAPASPAHAPAEAVRTAQSAGQQLAAGTADRQLDLARQGAWLDGLARDIATTGSASGTLRFQVAPQHLGAVQVELKQGADGATVTLTASNEASRSLLDQAKPQLVAEACTHGLSIASAQVDVGHGDARPGGDSQQSSGRSPDPRPDLRQDTGFSSQAGGQGSNGRSQTHSQPIAVNQDHERRAKTPAREAEADTRPARDDGLYA